MFAAFALADHHHGAGRHAVWCKANHITQDLLLSRTPERYFIPPYVGPSGWVGIYLDRRPDYVGSLDATTMRTIGRKLILALGLEDSI
jgi:hypothetical protein